MTQTPPVGEFPEFGHSERQLRAIIDGQPNGVVMIDRGGRIVLVNAQLLSDFHYSREELVGQSIEVLLPERFRAGHPGHRDGYFANPSPRAMGAGRNLFGRRKDGSEFPVELGLNPIETEEGMFVLGSVVDISQRKVIEEALEAKQRQVAASEERLKLILDGQPNGMVMINQAGEIVMVNSRLEKDFGYRREEMLGQKIELLVPKRFHRDHPGDRDRFFRDPRARAMGVGRDLFGQRKNGSEFPVELGLNPIETEEGMFVLGSVVDISQRKVIEQELEAKQREVAESEERLKLILDGQPNGMVMINRSGEIVMVNARLENDFGYSRDEMIGQNIELLVPKRFHPKHPGERDGFFQSPRTRVMGAGRDLFGERKDGSEFPVELGLNPISIGDEMFVVGSVVDITERKSAEEKLKALAQSLEVRNQDIRVLLDGVEQGFLTVTPDGVMSEERSGALDRWFGAPTTGMRISDFIAQFDPEAGAWTELGMDQVASEIIPMELAIAQLPSRFGHDSRTFAIDYTPIDVKERACFAVTIRDITSEVQREKLEAEQREILTIVSRIARDRAGFLEFFGEADEIVRTLLNDPPDDLVGIKRRVHTLKGNTSLFGLHRIEAICHELEDYMSEEGRFPRKREWANLDEAWRSVQSNVQSIVGFKRNVIELSEAEYKGLLVDVLSGRSHEDLAMRLTSWKLESTACYLDRAAEQARALASRLGKGNVSVTTRDESLRIEPASWSEFWSSFVHVVRNAIDHGLESEAERRECGKPERGRIELATEVTGGRFDISIRDDGRGIDWQRVAELATAKGLPAASHGDLVDALFFDGLSTAASITSTSGRGIGMMAVKTSCEALGGKISVNSEQKRGTEIRFSFPIETMTPHTTELLRINQVEAMRAWSSQVAKSN